MPRPTPTPAPAAPPARARRTRTVALAAALAVLLAPAAAPPATAAPPRPPNTAATGHGDDQPDPALAATALHRATATRRPYGDDDATTLTQLRAQLDRSAADAALALEAYQQATQVRDEAARRATTTDAALATADTALDDAGAALTRWIHQAYQDGGTLGTSPGLYVLLAGGSTGDVATTRTWIERTGTTRTRALARFTTARADRARAADTARHAADVAEAAAAQAAAARTARDAVLAGYRARLADLQARLAASRDATSRAGPLAGDRLTAAAVTGPDCPGRDTTAYPNGRIPPDALCPLWQAPGLLRADAAAAFDRMSHDHATGTGLPLCVTDAYRSYDDQVRVRAERGRWAATPGHSNHGLGIAADLCGGAEDPASAVQAWLQLHAPLYGWFHPAWAAPDGPLPEPWHWEYAGTAP